MILCEQPIWCLFSSHAFDTLSKRAIFAQVTTRAIQPLRRKSGGHAGNTSRLDRVNDASERAVFLLYGRAVIA